VLSNNSDFFALIPVIVVIIELVPMFLSSSKLGMVFSYSESLLELTCLFSLLLAKATSSGTKSVEDLSAANSFSMI
jgi:hypothetical protein